MLAAHTALPPLTHTDTQQPNPGSRTRTRHLCALPISILTRRSPNRTGSTRFFRAGSSSGCRFADRRYPDQITSRRGSNLKTVRAKAVRTSQNSARPPTGWCGAAWRAGASGLAASRPVPSDTSSRSDSSNLRLQIRPLRREENRV